MDLKKYQKIKQELRHLVYNSDVISLLQDGISKVLEGLTTLEELLKIIELDDDNNLGENYGLEDNIHMAEMSSVENKTPQPEVQSEPKPESNFVFNN